MRQPDDDTSDLLIRPATVDDTEMVLGLWSELIAYHKSIEPVRPRRWSQPGSVIDQLRPLLTTALADSARHAIFVACLGKQPVGFVRLAMTDQAPCPGQIETLYVHPEHRGRGIGQALVRHAVQWLTDRGIDEVSVDFIAPNVDARQFCERLGFRPFLVTHMLKVSSADHP